MLQVLQPPDLFRPDETLRLNFPPWTCPDQQSVLKQSWIHDGIMKVAGVHTGVGLRGYFLDSNSPPLKAFTTIFNNIRKKKKKHKTKKQHNILLDNYKQAWTLNAPTTQSSSDLLVFRSPSDQQLKSVSFHILRT